MSPHIKHIVTVSLVVLAAAIWVPQLFAFSRATPPPNRPEVDNGPPGGGQAADAAPRLSVAGDPRGAPEQGAASAEPLTPRPDDDSVSLLEETMTWVDVLGAQRGPVDLDELVAAFREQDPASGDERSGEEDPDRPVPPESAAESLEEFLASTVLRGVVHDGVDPVAMLGDRIVREGDVLSNGIEIVRIGRRDVWVARDDQRAVLELPAFVPRSSGHAAGPGSEGGGADDTGEGQGADSPGENDLDSQSAEPSTSAGPPQALGGN